MTVTPSQNRTLFNELAAVLRGGQLLFPDDAAYEQVRQLWNGRVKTRPAAIARCLTVQDVIHTIRWTRAHGLPLFEVLDTKFSGDRCARMASRSTCPR
ncbi:MAG: hypothetical protein V7K89_00345 [Nostoc sp.]|uniref:hypothetical protein n=1 Tax=Nostoc sp. TaxID=1180 RepID=UPI002FFD1967